MNEFVRFKAAYERIQKENFTLKTAEALAKDIYRVLIDSDKILIDLFEDYPDITHLQVYNALLYGIVDKRDEIMEACEILISEMDFIKDNFPQRNGKIYFSTNISESEKSIAEKRGAVWDDDTFQYYFEHYEDAYKFAVWLPYELSLKV